MQRTPSPWRQVDGGGGDGENCSRGHCGADWVASDEDDRGVASVLRVELRADLVPPPMAASRSSRSDAAWGTFLPRGGDDVPHYGVVLDDGNGTIEWCDRRREAFSCCGLFVCVNALR